MHAASRRSPISRRRRTAIRLHLVKRAARRRYTAGERELLRRTGRQVKPPKPRHHPAKAIFIKRLLEGDDEQRLNVAREAKFLGIDPRTLRGWRVMLEKCDGFKCHDSQGGRGIGITVTLNKPRLYEILAKLEADEAKLAAARAARAAESTKRYFAWKAQQRQWWIDHKASRARDSAQRSLILGLGRRDRRNPDPSPDTPFREGEKDLLGKLLRQDFESGTLGGGQPSKQIPPRAARGGAEIRASRVQLGLKSQNRTGSYPNPCPPANAIAARVKYEREQHAQSLAAGQKSQEDDADYQRWRQQRLLWAETQNSHPVTVAAQKEFERRRRADSMRELKRWQEEEAEFRRLRQQGGRLQ